MNPLASPMRMNGLRLSNPLVYVRQSLAGRVRDPQTHLYRWLAEEEINIEFLNLTLSGEVPHIAGCVDADSADRVSAILNPCTGDTGIESSRNFGMLSIYPHKYSLDILGRVLEIFGRANHRFFQMASSGSTLTFVVDFRDQEKIATSLVREIDLPETHTPFRQVMDPEDTYQSLNKSPETSATYTESRIRTYGILEKPGLFMYHMKTDQAGLAAAGKKIRGLADAGIKFCFVSAATGPGDRVFITIFTDKTEGCKSTDALPGHDIIHFQGPHFGDRHGIADRAFSALLQNEIMIVSAGCVGASIYIAVDAKTGVKAKNILGASFDDPFKIKSTAKNRGAD